MSDSDLPVRKGAISQENFIPLRHRELIRRLVEWLPSLTSRQSEQIHRVYHSLVSIFHVEHLTNLIQVEDLYESLDPDNQEFNPEPATLVAESAEQLFDRLANLLFSAHYHQLDQNELDNAITLGSTWGVKLNVNFSVFKRLSVFAKGYQLVRKRRRSWRRFFKREEVEFPEFYRLFIAFQLAEGAAVDPTMRADKVYLKIFKNIPENELEVLLPGSTVQLSLVDRTRILIPSLSGVALAIYKVTRGAMLITVFTLSAVYHWLLFFLLLVFYLGRGVLGYFQAKTRYQFGLTRNLYLKNLDNNVGVIYRLFNEAEEQEVCETILVYGCLLNQPSGMSDDALNWQVRQLLQRLTGQLIQFDIQDALGKLARFGLARVDSDARWQATPLDDALSTLEAYWSRQLGRKSPFQDMPGRWTS